MTTVTALPSHPSRQDPANFASRGDSFMAALPILVAEINAVAAEVNAAANEAAEDAVAAAIAATSSAFLNTSTDQTIGGTKGFTLSPTVPTPAQFDNSLKAASTAFVQQAIGNRKPYGVTITANTTLTSAYAGSSVSLGGTGSYTVNIPAPSAAAGMSFEFINYGSATVTIHTPSGTFNGAVYQQGVADVYSVPATAITVISDGTNWLVNSGITRSSVGQSGYECMANGLIRQWGYAAGVSASNVPFVVTLPIAWPSGGGFLNGHATVAGGPFTTGTVGVVPDPVNTLTKINLYNAAASTQNLWWEAIGH